MSRLAERFQDKPQALERSETPFSVQEVLVAGDLGPCGGVRMAIKTTQEILDYVNGREPVYANHEPVHNKLITDSFIAKGLVIEPDVKKIPRGAIWLGSAHGMDPHTVEEARENGIRLVNLECRLVTRVRRTAQ